MVSAKHLWSDLARAVLGIALGLGVVLAGSWRISAFLSSAGVALVGFALVVASTLGSGRALRLPLAAVGALALALVCALQALPVGGLAAVLSPHAASLFEGLGAPHEAVTYEVSATWREAAKLVVYALVLITSYQLARRRSVRLVLAWVPVVAAASIGVALVHRAFGLDSLFGIIPRRSADGLGLTTLPNPNHASGLLNLGALTALGLGMSWSAVRVRQALFVLSGALALTSVMQGSLGGLIGLAVGLVLFAVLVRRLEMERAPGWGLGLALGVPLVGALLGFGRLVDMLGLDAPEHRLDAKLEGILPALPMLRDHWMLGVGRGAFVSAFTRYRGSNEQLAVAFPENIGVQLMSEWGLLVGAVALAGLAFAVLVRIVRADHVASLAALCGVVAVLLQNLADFSLEVPGVAMIVAAVIGATTPHARAGRRRWLRFVGGARLAVAASLCVALVSSAGFALSAGDLDQDIGALVADGERVRAGAQPDLSVVEARAARHPANAEVQSQAAYLFTFAPKPNREAGLAAVNRALQLAPRDAQAAILVARILTRAGHRRQGLEELRRAWRLTSGVPATIRVAAAIAGSPEAFLDAVPRRDATLDLIDERAIARAVRFLARDHADWGPVLLAALPQVSEIPYSALADVGAAALLVGDARLAESAVRERLKQDPADPKALATLARLAKRSKRWDEAWDALVRLPAEAAARPENLELRFSVALERRDWAAADETLARMRRTLRMSRAREARLERLRAALDLAQDRPDRAVAAFDRALMWTPSDVEIRLGRARVLSELGRIGDAESDLRFVLRRVPGHHAAAAMLERLLSTGRGPRRGSR